MTSFSIVSLILKEKKKEPVIFSVSGEEKFPIRETIENDVIGPEFVVVQLYVFRLYNLDFQK